MQYAGQPDPAVMPDWPAISARLAGLGIDVRADGASRPVGGGDISAAWRIDAVAGPVFLKTGPERALAMFEAEADGLDELAAADALRVPRPLGAGIAGATAFVALEWLDFTTPTSDTETLLGERLAKLHRHVGPRFGWFRDNTIGRTPQVNSYCDDWVEFYARHRLGFQLDLAGRNGFARDLARGAGLVDRLPRFFRDYDPEPSLLHGDLWGGNWAAADGEPVIFDPAVYYGDREADLAMTRLFGGFSRRFYAAYEASWPLARGYERRLPLYQLYHVLNHLNLFGRGYLGRAVGLIDELV